MIVKIRIQQHVMAQIYVQVVLHMCTVELGTDMHLINVYMLNTAVVLFTDYKHSCLWIRNSINLICHNLICYILICHNLILVCNN
jgi:hypothetical protein